MKNKKKAAKKKNAATATQATMVALKPRRGRPSFAMIAERERLANEAAHKLVAKAFRVPKKALPAAKKLGGKKVNRVVVATANKQGWQRGERHHNSKLSNSQRLRIILSWEKGGVSQRQLAEKFGVNQSTVGHVIRNNRWVLQTA